MAFFPFNDSDSGITGAVAKGRIYKPSKEEALVYFNTENIDDVPVMVKE